MTTPLRQALAAMDAELMALMRAVVALEEAHEAAVRAVGAMEQTRSVPFHCPCGCGAHMGCFFEGEAG